jgi:hypothetical protein
VARRCSSAGRLNNAGLGWAFSIWAPHRVPSVAGRRANFLREWRSGSDKLPVATNGPQPRRQMRAPITDFEAYILAGSPPAIPLLLRRTIVIRSRVLRSDSRSRPILMSALRKLWSPGWTRSNARRAAFNTGNRFGLDSAAGSSGSTY